LEGEGFENVGGTGEVVAVPGKQPAHFANISTA
jgi:hypothetical protein